MSPLPLVVVWGLQATPLFLLAWLVTLLLRRSSAARRHFVWVLAVGGALLLPAASLVAPRVALPVLPAAAMGVPDATLNPKPSQEPDNVSRTPPPTVDRGQDAAFIPTSTPSAAVGRPLDWIYALGALGILLTIGISLVGTARLARRSSLVTDGGILEELEAASRAVGLRRPVRLLVHRNDTMPMTWGLVRPTILLPPAAAEWSRARLRAVLVHELAHVRRGDWLTQLAARAACVLYWWHPLAWVSARKLREERERACDDLVLAQGVRASDYAEQLLSIARLLRTAPVAGLAGVAMAKPSELSDRLLAVLDAARVRRPLRPHAAISGALLALAFVLPTAGMMPVRAAAPAPAGTTLPPPGEDLIGQTAVLPPRPPVIPAASGRDQKPASRTGAMASLCDWTRSGDSRSSHTNIDDDRATIVIVVDGCELSVRSSGRVGFTPDDRGVASIDGDGFFTIEERRGRDARRVEVDRRDGNLERRWYVNGQQQTWGTESNAWLSDMLLAMFRRTSFQARERARRIYAARGAEGLWNEIPYLFSTTALTAAYTTLIENGRLTSAEAKRIAGDIATRVTSSSSLSSVLSALLGNAGLDDASRAAIVQSAGKINSSSSRAEVLVAATQSGTLTPGLADAVARTAAGISSSSEKARVLIAIGQRLPAAQPLPDSYLTAASSISSSSELSRVLVALLERDQVTPARLASVLDATRSISSGSEVARVLVAGVTARPLEAETLPAFMGAVRQISSSSERERVLLAALRVRPTPATVDAVIQLAREISSSSSSANVLVAAAATGLVNTPTMRDAYRGAADGISSRSERERALRAIDR